MRYAIYHTPDRDDPLTIAAANWLGRDAFGTPPSSIDLPPHWSGDKHMALVADARRYGFHATLKAPFHLASGKTEADLLSAFDQLKLAREPIEIASLVLRQIDGFFALVPEEPNDLLHGLAALLVREFDRFRAPLSDTDILRRNPHNLTESQRSNLELWGYPYVFDDFFFHMTLTGRVHGQEAEAVRVMLEDRFGAFLHKPHLISNIAIFVEPSRGAEFAVRAIRPAYGSSPKGKSSTHA